MSDNAVYEQKFPLFALHGTIAVEYLDGTTLEGEFAAQDAFNIFVLVNNLPQMIPRLQIRLIRGLAGQSIEEDTTPVPHMVAPPALPPADTTAAGTFTLPPPTSDEPPPTEPTEPAAPALEEEEDEDDGTLILMQDEDDDEEFGTVILDTHESESAHVAEDEDELDMTVILGEDIEEPAVDDITMMLDETQEETPSATVTCTSGPHNGEVFKLSAGISTVGRSSDNVVPLSGDKEISRHHAIILYESGQFVIQDQNSLNGTFVNDEQVSSPQFLKSGDMILVGISHLKFEQ